MLDLISFQVMTKLFHKTLQNRKGGTILSTRSINYEFYELSLMSPSFLKDEIEYYLLFVSITINGSKVKRGQPFQH